MERWRACRYNSRKHANIINRGVFMLYIGENLKTLRKDKNLTQEEVAEILCVSPQSISKWERNDTLPDITMLPALANLYKVSVDFLIGMDKINDSQAKNTVFHKGHEYLKNNDTTAAIEIYSQALKTFPNDEDIMSDFAMTLALDNNPENLSRAITLCERVLSGGHGEKVHHTTRAALCFIYFKVGEKDKAVTTARKLPHLRESREMVLAQFDKDPTPDEIDSYLKFIAIGEADEQDAIEIDFGIDMVAVCTDYNLIEKIESLRKEIRNRFDEDDHSKLPPIRIRDKVDLAPNRIRIRHYADYLLDKEFSSPSTAATEIMKVLRKLAWKSR